MNKNTLTDGLFTAVDGMDAEAFASFLADDVVFRFANADPVQGKEATREVVAGFFAAIKALHHDIDRVWEQDDAVICEGMVTYTRHDSTTLEVPFVIVLILAGGLIGEYLIYVDASELFPAA